MCSKKIIVVDLDGTLTHTDTLYESILMLLSKKPLLLFILPFWLISGKAKFKANVANNIKLNVATLPYNQKLIKWLKKEQISKKKIILCSAANQHIAKAVADHLQLFDEVIASDAINNLKSINKRKVLDEKFGKKNYDYVGNSSSDIKVWAGARHAILVNASDSVSKQAKKVATVTKTFSSQTTTLSDWFKAFRIHHWVKNVLLFVPLFTANQTINIQSLSILSLAFISFSLCSSAIYIINDLLDLENDRLHPEKWRRPFATAKLSIKTGIVLISLLIIVSLVLAWVVGSLFFVLLILYIILTSIYSLLIKKIILLDCLALAILFTIRIFAGGAAIAIVVSLWLLFFSIFIFLSMAFIKRYAEIYIQIKYGNKHIHGRGYLTKDASLIKILGIISGCLSIVVFTFYLHSEKVTKLYSEPDLLLFVLPLLIFLISWIWIKAHRGKINGDPIMFAIKDKASLLAAGLMVAIFLLA